MMNDDENDNENDSVNNNVKKESISSCCPRRTCHQSVSRSPHRTAPYLLSARPPSGAVGRVVIVILEPCVLDKQHIRLASRRTTAGREQERMSMSMESMSTSGSRERAGKG